MRLEPSQIDQLLQVDREQNEDQHLQDQHDLHQKVVRMVLKTHKDLAQLVLPQLVLLLVLTQKRAHNLGRMLVLAKVMQTQDQHRSLIRNHFRRREQDQLKDQVQDQAQDQLHLEELLEDSIYEHDVVYVACSIGNYRGAPFRLMLPNEEGHIRYHSEV